MPPETSAIWPVMFNYGLSILMGIIAWNVREIIIAVKELKTDVALNKTNIAVHGSRIDNLEREQ